MFQRVRSFISAFQRAQEAANMVRRAHSLHATGQLAEATSLLMQARSIADRPGTNWFLMGAQATNRLRAASLLSITAAKSGNRPLALEAIEEAMALWTETKPHIKPGPTAQGYVEWESWAKQYANSTTEA
jgi:hypothetical protein